MENRKELPRIDFEKGEFEANGKKYFIEGNLSIERYAELQILEKELAYGLTTKLMFEKLKVMWDNSNKLKFAENAVILRDLMTGVMKANERMPTVLKICALFINTENEDRAALSNDVIESKIKDWKEAGLDMRDFFTVAVNSVNGFLEVYRTVTRIISEAGEL